MNQLITIAGTFLFVCLSFFVEAQNFDPTILILSPNKIEVEEIFDTEIAEYNSMMKEQMSMSEKEMETYLAELKNEPENIQLMAKKQLEFTKHASFSNLISMIAESYLQYRFYERFENLLIYATDETSDGSKQSVSKLANTHNMQYVLSFPEVNSYMKNELAESTIRVQLFDSKQQLLLLDKEFVGDSTNPGFEFACEEGIFCTFSNALSQALPEVIQVVAENNPTLKNERALAKQRIDVLLKDYYSKTPNTEIVEIINSNSDIETKGYYQGFMSEDKTKFIGFFALDNEIEGIKDMKDRGDKNVSIISDDVFNGLPKIYSYVVTGVMHNSKWYMKKQEVTYFDADNLDQGKKLFFGKLMGWGFFKDGDTQYDSMFWERHFFERVKDVTKEPDYEQYKDMYEDDERKDKDYIGMYELVADELKKDAKQKRVLFEEEVEETILLPFLNKKIEDGEFDNYYLLGKKFIFIYPKNESVVLCPINIEIEGVERLHYYVVMPEDGKLYEWAYFEKMELENAHGYYASAVIDQLEEIVKWHFGFETLDEDNFWKEYVLAKKDGEFTYLAPLN